jgi:integrase
MKLTIRTIKTIPIDPNRDVYVWDDDLAGFGARFKPSGVISFFIQYRNVHGTSRRLTLGKMGVLTPEEARTEARLKLADVAKGIDPAGERKADREAMTVKELCSLYMGTVKKMPGPRGRIKKPSTIKADQSRIDKHIIPLVGSKPVVSLTLRDVEKLQANIATGKTAQERPEKGRSGVVAGGHAAAARTIGLFSTMLEFARRQGIIGSNPAQGVKKFPDQKRNRFLSQDEIKALGAAMQQAAAEGENKTGIAAIQALLLTGCRRNEILSLPWAWLDDKARCIRFADTKSGAQIRPVGGEAIKLFLDQPRREIIGKDKKKKECPWIFPSDRGDGHFIGLPHVLARLCARAGVKGITLHTLRHTFASVAAELGYTELTIAGLLGHTARGVTNRYSHLPDSALLSAADRVAAHIAALLGGNADVAEVVQFIKKRR